MTGIDPALAIPVLPSPDLAMTRQFYQDQLGFDALVYEAEGYLIVRRDRLELHFWLTEDQELPKVSSCYIRGGQVVALFEEYSNRNVPGLTPFEVRPWDMKEFYIHDPHGNLLRFGAAPEEL